jgi:glycosyltransferase involved in cell wall biosynthesis
VIQSCVALLGKRDEPTDAVEEYCRYLGDALKPYRMELEICRVPWEIHGWSDALRTLRLQAANWGNRWVLVQYTALAWSARGFPQKIILLLKILKSTGARVAIVFHDVQPYPGTRVIDTIRRYAQILTMRKTLSISDLLIFTVPPEKLNWLTTVPPNAVFIPVGPNLPIPLQLPFAQNAIPTIGVFSITGGKAGTFETKIIVATVRHAAMRLGKIRLLVFGRHAELREAEVRDGLCDLNVDVSVDGVIEPQRVVQKLFECDVLLFIRGPISSRRGSAIAGIACGLPVIAYAGSETAPPITDAGVVLVSQNKPSELNNSLVRILSDDSYRTDLAFRSRAAYQTHFAWSSIATRFAALLNAR